MDVKIEDMTVVMIRITILVYVRIDAKIVMHWVACITPIQPMEQIYVQMIQDTTLAFGFPINVQG
jgi:hypothetical protein